MHYTLGSLVIDSESLTILRGRQTIAAPPKVVETLAALCANAGNFVTKETLAAQIWGSGYADDSTVWQKIHLVRALLREHVPGAIVETLPRRGYRLVPPAAPTPKPARVFAAAGFAALCALCLALAVKYVLPADAALSGSAYRDYKLGEYFLNQRTLDGAQKAERDFKETIAASPRSALGYAGLADTYSTLSISTNRSGTRFAERALQDAAKAVVLDPNSAATQSAYGLALYVRSLRNSRENAAEAESAAIPALSRALQIDPAYAPAHLYLGEILLGRGEIRRARAELQRAVDLDPSVPIANVWLALAAYLDGDSRSAIAYARSSIGFATSDEEDALLVLGLSLENERNFAAAHDAYAKLQRYSWALGSVMLASVDARDGRARDAQRELAHAIANGGCRCTKFWLNIARAEARLRRYGEAAAYREMANRHADPRDAWRFEST